MAKATKAISLGVSALVVIAIILIVGFGVYLNDTFNTTSTTSSSSVTVFECCASIVTTSSSGSSSTMTSSVITTSSTSQPVATNGKVFLYNEIPYQFAIGDFTINLVYDGTGYITPPANGTSTMFTGFAFAFNITTPNGKTTNIFFLWNPPCNINYGLPCQIQNEWVIPNFENNANEVNATLNYEQANLSVSWFTNSTGLFASFQQFDISLNTHTVTSTMVNSTLTISTSLSASQTSSTTNNTIITSGETCTPMNTGNQTSVTETYLCHTEVTASFSSSG